jgi:Ca2+-binding RTX toxin-like protein
MTRGCHPDPAAAPGGPEGRKIMTWHMKATVLGATVLVTAAVALVGSAPARATDACTYNPGAQTNGTPGNDVIVGTAGDDILNGNGGDDQIFGLGGEDIISGGPGDDSILGGDCADFLMGGNGNDVLAGEEGDDDMIAGDSGTDTAYGGPGENICAAERLVPPVLVPHGYEYIIGPNGEEYLHAEACDLDGGLN